MKRYELYILLLIFTIINTFISLGIAKYYFENATCHVYVEPIGGDFEITIPDAELYDGDFIIDGVSD